MHLKQYMLATQTLVQANNPGVPYFQCCATPYASGSSDSFETVGNQTAANGSGGPTSNRAYINEVIKQNFNALLTSGFDGVIDPNPWVESGYVSGVPNTVTGLWMVDGSASSYTFDGTHPTSYASSLIADGLATSGYNPFLSSMGVL